jgi:O-glycosyl hydrolase
MKLFLRQFLAGLSLAGLATSLPAAVINMTVQNLGYNDAMWNYPPAAPAVGNDYVAMAGLAAVGIDPIGPAYTATFRALDSATPYVFAGNSLTVPAGVRLLLKMEANDVAAITNLILNGGYVVEARSGTVPGTATLGGTINVAGNSTLGVNQNIDTTLNVTAAINGSGTLNLAVANGNNLGLTLSGNLGGFTGNLNLSLSASSPPAHGVFTIASAANLSSSRLAILTTSANLSFNLVSNLTVGSLMVGSVPVPAGTYTAAQLNTASATTSFTGGATLTVLALPPTVVTVDPNYAIVPNFDGWGTSLAWWGNVCGGYPNRSTYAALAFTTLKLNIVRYNIGGGANTNLPDSREYRARMPCLEPTNGVWDWTADANQRWMLKQAVALGVNRVVAFANSPPWWMTVSGSSTGAVGSTNNLQTAYETGFANFLATVVSNLTVLDGVHFDLVTPMNEPTGNYWNYGDIQEGCHMDPVQQARMVNDLRPALNAQNVSAGIDASEDTSEQGTLGSLGAYGSATANVALVASHTYNADNPAGLRNLAAGWQKPAWISEYGDNDATGMTMARRIHDDITGTWVRAWIYWQVVDYASGWGFLYNPLNGNGDSSFTYNKKFYIMGQFSQNIRPGSQILGVNDTNSLVAYNATNHTLVIVAVNGSGTNLNVTYDLSAFGALPVAAYATRTSPTENSAGIAPALVAGQQFSATLIPQSVTTFTLNNVPAPVPGMTLLAWYPFEGNTLDATGHGNGGTLANVVFVAGKLGTFAAQFNSSSSYVQIPRSISNDFTISFWVKTTDAGGTGQWWAGEGLVDGEVPGTADDFGVSLTGGRVSLGVGNPDTTVTTTGLVNNGQWHHVAATRDAVSGALAIYVDGGLQASGFGPVGTKAAPPALRIGSLQSGGAGGFLNGTIDDVQLFGRVFAPGEISLLMNHPPQILVAPATYSLLGGRTLVVTNAAVDPDVPAQSLSWSLLTPPAGATIGAASGIFNWRPPVAATPYTNAVTVQVADNGTPSLTATQNFNVIVLPPQSPTLSVPMVINGLFSLTVSGDAGPDYIIQTTTNLTDASGWTPVYTNAAATPPFQWTIPVNLAAGPQFYRIVLAP